MDRTQKESFVSALRERVNRAPVLYLTDFSGLNVKAMTRLYGEGRRKDIERRHEDKGSSTRVSRRGNLNRIDDSPPELGS